MTIRNTVAWLGLWGKPRVSRDRTFVCLEMAELPRSDQSAIQGAGTSCQQRFVYVYHLQG